MEIRWGHIVQMLRAALQMGDELLYPQSSMQSLGIVRGALIEDVHSWSKPVTTTAKSSEEKGIRPE